MSQSSISSERLSWRDYTLLSLFCLILFSFPLFNNRVLTTHETVHCQNVREMMQGGDWIIPHYGGRVWMERPPLPFWITAAFVKVFGDNPVAFRLAPLVMGWWCVVLTAWMASVWYGRTLGLASGLILATMREFTHYSTGPEADMFLCAIVTSTLALFVFLEFHAPLGKEEGVGLLGRRPWVMLAFFMVCGLTNLAKGLFFGTIFVGLPITVYLLWNARWRGLRRYVWLPGWLAYFLVSSLWAVAAYWQYPGVIDFWKNDYGSRVNQGYMAEPFWYYFAQWPWVVFPWPVLVVLGFWQTKSRAFGATASPERFLWCWALAPIFFFSIPQGKHHHYLLQTMAPWAVLGALGARYLWNRLTALSWQQYFLRATLGACLISGGIYCVAYALRTTYWDRYHDDSQFLRAAGKLVPVDKPILVMDDDAPLNASWLLFYLDGRGTMLHNITFLKADNIHEKEIYLITRKTREPSLGKYGNFVKVLESTHSRYENSPDDRYALYQIAFYEGLERAHGPVAINPLQATGRAAGPFLQ